MADAKIKKIIDNVTKLFFPAYILNMSSEPGKRLAIHKLYLYIRF